jgi:hypothetical protein
MIKGNSTISRTRARRALEQMSRIGAAQQVFDAVGRQQLVTYVSEFVREHREEIISSRIGNWLDLASNLSAPPRDYEIQEALEKLEARALLAAQAGFVDFTFSDEQVQALVTSGNIANYASGHKFNHFHKRKKPRPSNSTCGFSFKPEIPYKRAGIGILFSTNGEHWDDLGDEMDYPRYTREQGDEQSMPKVEWSVARHWKNARLPRFPTTKQSQEDQRTLSKYRQEPSEHFRRVFAQDNKAHRYG